MVTSFIISVFIFIAIISFAILRDTTVRNKNKLKIMGNYAKKIEDITWKELLKMDGYEFISKTNIFKYGSTRFKSEARGHITVEREQVFLCQNVDKGDDCSNKRGYDYSFRVTESDAWFYKDFIKGIDIPSTKSTLTKLNPKQGDILQCVKNLEMGSSELLEAYVGLTYNCSRDGYFTGESGREIQIISDIEDHFLILSEGSSLKKEKVSLKKEDLVKEVPEDSKFTIIEHEWIPKVDDWVVIQRSVINWNPEMDKFINKCVKITEVKKDDKYLYIIKFESSERWVWEYKNKHYRKALPHEISFTKQMIAKQYGISIDPIDSPKKSNKIFDEKAYLSKPENQYMPIKKVNKVKPKFRLK